MEIRPKVTHKGNTLVFASPEDGHLYKEDGTQIEEFTDGNGFKRAYIDDRHYNVSFLNAKTFFPDDIQIMVGHKDGNRSNNKKDNLFWYGKEEVDEIEEKRKENLIIPRKPVYMKNVRTGEIICYKDSTEASKALGLSESAVNGKINRKALHNNQYLLLREIENNEKENIIIRQTQDEKMGKIVKKKLYKKVNQIDPKTNEVIRTFESLQEAYNTVKGTTSQGISNVLSGRNNTHGGYKWRYANDELNIERKKIDKRVKGRVQQIDPKTGEVIKTFDNPTAASKELGLCLINIYKCIKRNNTTGGFKWRYEDQQPNEEIDKILQPLSGQALEENRQKIERIIEESKNKPLPFDEEPEQDKDNNKDIQMKEVIDNSIEMIENNEVLATYKDITTLGKVMNLSHREIAEHIVKGEPINGYIFKWIG